MFALLTAQHNPQSIQYSRQRVRWLVTLSQVVYQVKVESKIL